MVINMFGVTSTTFLRTSRCMSWYVLLFYELFWCFVFVVLQYKTLMIPEENQTLSEFSNKNSWVPFVVPIISHILTYLYAALFKVSDQRISKITSIQVYRRVM